MGFSCKIYFNKSYIKKDGACSIYLQVIIDRKKKVIPLGLEWPHRYCSDNQDLCQPRRKADPDVDDMNIMLRDSLAKANEIFKYFRIAGRKLTLESFLAHWENENSATDFLEYFETRMNERFRNREFGLWSYKRYKSTLSWLRQYKPCISFADFNQKWAYDFDTFLKRKINSRNTDTQNTRWGYHKYVKVILNYARDVDQISFVDPYQFFSISQKKGNWQSLKTEELKSLDKYYRETPHKNERLVLRRFLFSCATSLRLGDLYRVEPTWREGDWLIFKPQKTFEKTNKEVRVPLSSWAQELWQDAVKEKQGRLFDDFEEQYSNRVLKKIARKTGVKTNIHHHVARHTWTTMFLGNGGNVRIAQQILAHADIKTTMKYDHIDFDQVMRELPKMQFIQSSSSSAA